MDDVADHDLLERARQGDRAALEQLLEQSQERIYRFGMRMCGDPEDAKEVLQETLLAVARSIGDFRGSSSLSTWLYTIARRFCMKSRRKKKDAPERHLSLETGAGGGAIETRDPSRLPDQEAEGRQMQEAIAQAILALPREQREVLVLRDVEGLKASEVGEVLDLSVAAVKSRLHRARLEVRSAVEGAAKAPAAGCPDVLSLYSQYLEGDIGPELCAQMEQHLEACERCRGACDSLKRTLRMCRTSPASEPVPEEVREAVRTSLRELTGS